MTDPTLPTPPPPGQRVNRYGRAGALTPDLHDRIVEVVRAGNYLKTAAQFAGVGVSTLSSWLARGRAANALVEAGQDVPPEEERYLAFLEAVTQAETVAEVSAVTHWRRAWGGENGDWRAARDYLARKRPEQWAAKTTVAISSDEAEARIDNAVMEALLALGVDTGGLDLEDADEAGPLPGEIEF